MTLVLGHITALEYWLSPPATQATLTRQLTHREKRAIERSERVLLETLSSVSTGVLSAPLHLLAASSKRVRSIPPLTWHTITTDLPDGAFRQISNDVLIASVELAFVQAAQTLSIIDLIRLGYELCGGYSLDEMSHGGFFKRNPLTTPCKLKQLIEMTPRMRGRAAAQRALRYVLPGSASPSETKLAIALTLPHKLGGLGLPPPELNKHIKLSAAEQRISGNHYLKCDLFWPENRLGVEYDSDDWHTGSEKISEDAARRNLLACANVTVLTVTRLQYNNREELIRTAKIIAKQLGTRFQPRCENFMQKHQALRDLLYTQPEWESRRRVHPFRMSPPQQSKRYSSGIGR